MTARRILLLTYHFPPSGASGSFRLLGFARHLPRFGWQPIVVAPPQIPWEPVDPGLGRQVPPEAVVCPVPYPQGLLSKPLRRLAPYAVWLAPAWWGAVRAVRRFRPDAVLTSGPPHWVHLLGLGLRSRFRLPWVADFRDPWVADGKSQPARSLRRRWQAYWERAVMRGADAIVANAPLASQSMQAAYPLYQDKVITITNGYDAESFLPRPPAATVNRRVTLLHAGELYYGRDPRPFLDALGDLTREQPAWTDGVQVRFVGSVTAKHFEAGFDFQREVNQRGLESAVRLEGRLPYQQVLHELSTSDILLMLDTPGRRIGIPAKAYEYLGTGRPLLALSERDGDVAWLLRESGIPHRIAPPGDRGPIKQALLELVNEVRTGGLVAPDREKLAQFTRAHLTGRLAGILDAFVAEHRRPSREAITAGDRP
jgi:glycosyltransferase involved in cell wall biosynthesis